MSESEDGLTLDAVVKRFADSERALGEVRERLTALAASATEANASAASLRETADSVREFAQRAAMVTDELREVTAQARGVLERGAAVLDGSALRAIEQRLVEVVGELREAHTSMAGSLHEIEARVTRIDAGAARIFKNTLPRRQRNLEYPGE
ncbi:MAG TPA: hypothetical protein VNJ46_04915 [Gaiellaceae bacterium]|nr:hypothetical protein [Gaiellaceae bacterium]